MHCWNCKGAPGAGPFCEACKKIQPLPAGSTHFSVLGVPMKFALEGAEIDRRYRELQRKLHPDRFAMAPAEERRMSLSWATAVNDAQKALKHPVTRAEYLMKLAGIPVVEQGNEGAG